MTAPSSDLCTDGRRTLSAPRRIRSWRLHLRLEDNYKTFSNEADSATMTSRASTSRTSSTTTAPTHYLWSPASCNKANGQDLARVHIDASAHPIYEQQGKAEAVWHQTPVSTSPSPTKGSEQESSPPAGAKRSGSYPSSEPECRFGRSLSDGIGAASRCPIASYSRTTGAPPVLDHTTLPRSWTARSPESRRDPARSPEQTME